MIRRLPVIPTLIVAVAVAVMLRLGFWQLDRMHRKEALLAHYAAGEHLTGEVAYPRGEAGREDTLYRRSRLQCLSTDHPNAMSGRSAAGVPGFAHTVNCRFADGETSVVLGWSREPRQVEWAGGEVKGFIGPGANGDVRLIADPPLVGLEANARPDPNEVPNNHLSYAVQWFLFALTAVIIYVVAVMKRLKG
jgi:surfeit locus 1 family protein